MKGKPSKSLGGIKEIARRADVAIATVDRVIHNRNGVSKKTHAKITAIMKEMNYRPNMLASRLASRKTYHFAVLLPKVSMETDFWNAPLKGIERAENEIGQYGIKVLKFFFSLNSRASFNKQADLILKHNVDGLLLAPSFIRESVKLIEACEARNMPYVLINSDIATQESQCYIGPHLFQSGYLAAHLLDYSVSGTGKVLVVNISKELDTHHHLLRIEEGFRSYYKNQGAKAKLIKTDIRRTDYRSIEKNLSVIFAKNPDIKAIFATNSRVSSVAHFVETLKIKNLVLIGFDFLEENIKYLKRGTIDFLICQKPELQGYKGILALYEMLVLKKGVNKINYVPNDIITRANFLYYHT